MFLLELKRKVEETLFAFVAWVSRHIATRKQFHRKLLIKGKRWAKRDTQ
jgi:hypothetical protein